RFSAYFPIKNHHYFTSHCLAGTFILLIFYEVGTIVNKVIVTWIEMKYNERNIRRLLWEERPLGPSVKTPFTGNTDVPLAGARPRSECISHEEAQCEPTESVVYFCSDILTYLHVSY